MKKEMKTFVAAIDFSHDCNYSGGFNWVGDTMTLTVMAESKKQARKSIKDNFVEFISKEKNDLQNVEIAKIYIWSLDYWVKQNRLKVVNKIV